MAKNCSCWKGYKRVKGTEPCAPNSCKKVGGKRKKRTAADFMEISTSKKRGKKWKAKVGGKTYHAGDSNYTIAPGTPKGDRYCARSHGIMKKHGKTPKNTISRKKWKCKGKKSMKR